jgi:hypothetical protein
MSQIDQKTYEIVLDWLKSLGVLCAGNMTVEDARTRCGAYATMLSEAFPAAAFTRKSLEEVASRCKWFPSYAEVVAALGEIRRESLTIQQRMGAVPIREITQQFVPDSEEVQAATLAKAEALIAELSAGIPERATKPVVEPRYFTKLQLALAASPEMLAIRPDLRAALAEHQGAGEGR